MPKKIKVRFDLEDKDGWEVNHARVCQAFIDILNTEVPESQRENAVALIQNTANHFSVEEVDYGSSNS